MDEYQLTTDQVNREIQQEDIPFLAVHFDNVDFYIYVMGLSPGERSDVLLKKNESNHLAMIECLTIWKRKKLSQATFGALLEMLVKLKKEAIAAQVCQCITVSVFVFLLIDAYQAITIISGSHQTVLVVVPIVLPLTMLH